MVTSLSLKSNAHLDYEQQLIAVDAATAIYVIEFKIPAELLLHSGLQHQTQSSHVLHEINEAVLQEKKEAILSILPEIMKADSPAVCGAGAGVCRGG